MSNEFAMGADAEQEKPLDGGLGSASSGAAPERPLEPTSRVTPPDAGAASEPPPATGASPPPATGASPPATSLPVPLEAVRYVRFVADSDHAGTAFTAVAEFEVLDEDGNVLDRTGWIASADIARN
jgi:hypothetical protein